MHPDQQISSRRSLRRRLRVPSSLSPVSRAYPATSAARMAASSRDRPWPVSRRWPFASVTFLRPRRVWRSGLSTGPDRRHACKKTTTSCLISRTQRDRQSVLIGHTRPRSVISPVIATSRRVGMPVITDDRGHHGDRRRTVFGGCLLRHVHVDVAAIELDAEIDRARAHVGRRRRDRLLITSRKLPVTVILPLPGHHAFDGEQLAADAVQASPVTTPTRSFGSPSP